MIHGDSSQLDSRMGQLLELTVYRELRNLDQGLSSLAGTECFEQRSPSKWLVATVLVAAITLGGSAAYFYKHYLSPQSPSLIPAKYHWTSL